MAGGASLDQVDNKSFLSVTPWACAKNTLILFFLIFNHPSNQWNTSSKPLESWEGTWLVQILDQCKDFLYTVIPNRHLPQVLLYRRHYVPWSLVCRWRYLTMRKYFPTPNSSLPLPYFHFWAQLLAFEVVWHKSVPALSCWILRFITYLFCVIVILNLWKL